MTTEKKIEILRKFLFVGERDPQRNPDFVGAYMVAEYGGGFCIVGDCLADLVDDAIQYWGII